MNQNLAKVLFYMMEFLRGENVRHYLKELEYNQFLAKDAIRDIQRKKLVKLLDYVKNNNLYYNKKFKNYNNFDLFESFPVLTKDELRENFRNILSIKPEKKLDLVETSGSTGIPLRFFRDRVVFGYNLASVYRAHRWWNLDIGCKEAMLWGIPAGKKKRVKARLKDFVLNRFREKEYDITSETLNTFYHDIINKKPDYLFGYSSMIYEFALYLKCNSLSLKGHNLKAVICTAEKMAGYQRSLIEEIMGRKVVSEYGATETGIISYECPKGSNHIADDCVYLEIVDEKNIPVPDGQAGRVLVTVLNGFSSPVIRYELGDIACRSKKECSCGVNLSLLDNIEGRTSDIVVGPDGQIYHSIIFYYIMKELTEKTGGIRQFKVCQKKTDELEFHIVKDSGSHSDADAFIKLHVKSRFGEAMHLKIFYHDQIKRDPSGKLRDFETDIDVSKFLKKSYGLRSTIPPD